MSACPTHASAPTSAGRWRPGPKASSCPRCTAWRTSRQRPPPRSSPPKGDRGICPAIRAAGYNFATFDEYTAWNNREIALVPLIENPDGVASIDAICAHPDVHMVTFGSGDLAYSVGEGTAMMAGPTVQEDYKKVLAAAKKHSVAVIGGPVLTPNAQDCRQALEDGVTIFCLGLDSLGFRLFCEQTVQALADAATGSPWTRPPVPASGFSAASHTAR